MPSGLKIKGYSGPSADRVLRAGELRQRLKTGRDITLPHGGPGETSAKLRDLQTRNGKSYFSRNALAGMSATRPVQRVSLLSHPLRESACGGFFRSLADIVKQAFMLVAAPQLMGATFIAPMGDGDGAQGADSHQDIKDFVDKMKKLGSADEFIAELDAQIAQAQSYDAKIDVIHGSVVWFSSLVLEHVPSDKAILHLKWLSEAAKRSSALVAQRFPDGDFKKSGFSTDLLNHYTFILSSAVKLEKGMIEASMLTREAMSMVAGMLDAFARNGAMFYAVLDTTGTVYIAQAIDAMLSAIERYDILGDKEASTSGRAFIEGLMKRSGLEGHPRDIVDAENEKKLQIVMEFPSHVNVLAASLGYNYESVWNFYRGLTAARSLAGKPFDKWRAVAERYKKYHEELYSFAKVTDPFTGEMQDASLFTRERILDIWIRSCEFWFDKVSSFIEQIGINGDVDAIIRAYVEDRQTGESYTMADRSVKFFWWVRKRFGDANLEHLINDFIMYHSKLADNLKLAGMKLTTVPVKPASVLRSLFETFNPAATANGQWIKYNPELEFDGNMFYPPREFLRSAVEAMKDVVGRGPSANAEILLGLDKVKGELIIGDRRVPLVKSFREPNENEIAHPITGEPLLKALIDEHSYLRLMHELREHLFEAFQRAKEAFVRGSESELSAVYREILDVSARAGPLHEFGLSIFRENLENFYKSAEHLFFIVMPMIQLTTNFFKRSIQKGADERATLADRLDNKSVFKVEDAVKFYLGVFKDIAGKYSVELKADAEDLNIPPEQGAVRDSYWNRAADQVIWTALTRAKTYVRLKWNAETSSLIVEGDFGEPRPAREMRQDVRADGFTIEGAASLARSGGFDIGYLTEDGRECYVLPVARRGSIVTAGISDGELELLALLRMGVQYYTGANGQRTAYVDHDRYWLFMEGGLKALGESLFWHKGEPDEGGKRTIHLVRSRLDLSTLVSGAAVVPFSLFKNVGGKFTMAVMTEPGVLLPHAVIQKALAKDGLAGTEAFIYGYASCFDGRLNLYEVRSKENLERPDEVLARLGFGPFHEVEVNLGANGIKRFKPQ